MSVFFSLWSDFLTLWGFLLVSSLIGRHCRSGIFGFAFFAVVPAGVAAKAEPTGR